LRALDSDHCIAILGGQLDLRSHVSPDEELALMAVNVGELVHGARKSTRPKENLTRLDIFFTALLVLPYDEGSARRFGVLKALLEHPDELISDMD
jgi:tRNA(fMet)-specific endonuclease VapC